VLADGEEANLQSQLYTAKQLVSELVGMDSKLSGVLDMLEEAAIQLSEASDELRHYHDRLDLDPNRLFELEQRISRQIALARKHQVMPEELPAVYQAMLEEQRLLDDSAGSLESLSQRWSNIISWRWRPRAAARPASASADELTQLITESMHSLSMPHGVFAIEVALMNAISPPKAPTILSSASPLTRSAAAADRQSGLRRRTVAYCAGDSGDHRA
jgi:DNA repair protein RecN (Recombination protein N)